MGNNLVTKSEYKAYAGLTSPTQDAQIDSIIPKVSELVKSICNRTFVDYVDDAKVEYYDGGTNYHVLKEYPVIAITSVEYSADYGNTYTTLTEYTDFAVRKTDDTLIPIGATEFPYAINGYRITYTGGYTELPSDLKLAVLDLVTYYLRNDMAVHSNKAQGTNTVQIEYVTTTNLPAHIKRVFDLYTASLA